MKQFVFLMLSFCAVALVGQDVKDIMNRADHHFNEEEFAEAIPLYREVLMYDDNKKARRQLCYSYSRAGNLEQATYWYEYLFANKEAERKMEFEYAQLLQKTGDCEKAKAYFRKYSSVDPSALAYADACENLDKFRKNEALFLIESLAINTGNAEFAPVIYGSDLIYTGSFSENTQGLFQAVREEEGLSPQKLRGEMGSQKHIGSACINTTGTLMWYSRNAAKEKGKDPVLELAWAEVSEKGKWEDVAPFQHNPEGKNAAHPSLSADGKRLFFMSDQKGGYGGTDIYMSVRRDTSWSAPINLGPSINTAGNELFPFIHSDGTLYFCSNGLPGMGGIDVYYSTRRKTKWEKARNLGAPVNSIYDDFSFIYDEQRVNGYFASNRPGGKGKDDIYRVIRKGAVSKPIEKELDAPVVLANAADGKIINKQLGIAPFAFEDKRASLLVESYADLDKVIRYMKKNVSKKLLIEVHTDTRGQSEGNRVLSIDRATGIRNLMVFKGIDLGRLEIAGIGEGQPLKDCDKRDCKPEEQAQNNRVNFRLIDKEYIEVFGDEPEEEDFIDFSKEIPEELENSQKTKESKEKVEKQLERERKKQEKQLQKEQERMEKEKRKLEEAAMAINDEPAPVVLKRPRLKTTKNSKGYSYLVEIGPFKTVSPELADIILKMKLQASLRPSGTKEWVQLGAFATMAECEQLQAYLDQEGFGKSKLIVLVDGERSTIKASKLKKEGLK